MQEDYNGWMWMQAELLLRRQNILLLSLPKVSVFFGLPTYYSFRSLLSTLTGIACGDPGPQAWHTVATKPPSSLHFFEFQGAVQGIEI